MTNQDLSALSPAHLSGAALLEKAEAVAIAKTQMDAPRVFVLAIMAGMQIGLGALFMTFVKADLSLSFAAASVLGGLCFSLGLICVIVAGSELFTGNTLMVAAAMDKKIPWSALWKNWGLVLLGNLLGSLILVGIIVGAGVWNTQAGENTIGAQMMTIAASKVSLSPAQIFFRGIGCNFLVCLAVWMAFAGKTVIDKIFTTIFPVMAFVALGFEHCVANMYFLPMGVIASQSGFSAAPLSWLDAAYNIVIATIGNTVGGAIFVGLLYWFAYRKAGAPDAPDAPDADSAGK